MSSVEPFAFQNISEIKNCEDGLKVRVIGVLDNYFLHDIECDSTKKYVLKDIKVGLDCSALKTVPLNGTAVEVFGKVLLLKETAVVHVLFFNELSDFPVAFELVKNYNLIKEI